MKPVDLSVVIGAHNAARTIAIVLAALEAQLAGIRSEIIVAVAGDDDMGALVAANFPDVTLLSFGDPMNLPLLRGQAIARSRGRIVAILDPYSVPAPSWARELLLVHGERPNAAIGGAVHLYQAERQGPGRWATYLNEYGRFAPPLEAGPARLLPGSNISYKAEALGDRARYGREGFWKTFVNSGLRANADPLWLAPSVIVHLLKPIRFGDFLRSRFHHGRCYAAMRVADAPSAERYWRTISAPLLPAVFLWRQLRDGLPKSSRRHLLGTLPLQLLLFSAWSWGELCGYAFGERGSCRHLVY